MAYVTDDEIVSGEVKVCTVGPRDYAVFERILEKLIAFGNHTYVLNQVNKNLDPQGKIVVLQERST
jgi:hypothetical protein